MPSYQPPLKNSTYVFYVSLVSQANTKIMVTSATLASGDVKSALDDAVPANLATLPVVDADYTKRIKVSLSAAEMNGDRITVVFSDVSGAEWCDLTVDIATVTNQFDSLATAAALTIVDDLLDTEIPALTTAVGLLPTAAAIATAVWASGTRTLTSFGTLIADIWVNITRTLTQPAAQVTASVTGSDLTIVRAVTFTATLTGLTIPATWSKVYFTVKKNLGAADSQAMAQVLVSNPGVGTDGLLVINKAVAATLAQASLTVNQGAGSVVILLTDDATAQMVDAAVSADDVTYSYDLKVLLSDGSSQLLTSGDALVTSTPTKTIA